MLRVFRVIAIVVAWFIASSPAFAHATPEKKLPGIRSGSEIGYPPFCDVNSDNEAEGFSVDLLRAVLREMGREVRFKNGSWAEVKQLLADGKIDVLPLVGRTPEREALFDFTSPYLTLHGTIVVRSDVDNIHNLQDLRGKEVAVMRGDNAEEFVRRGDLGLSVATTETFAEALTNLEGGAYDAVIIQKLLYNQLSDEYGFDNLKEVGKPLSDFKQSFCFAVKEDDRDLLQLLNEGLAIVFANGTFEKLYRKWILPLEHKEHIKSRIVIGGDSNYPPYEYLDENGQPAGYNIELTKAVAREMGLDIDIALKPWNQVREDLETGKIDVVHGMFYSQERDEVFSFSPAHILISHVVVTNSSANMPDNLADLDGKSVVAMSGDITHDLLLQRGKAQEIITVDSQEDVLRLVATGQYDYGVTAKVPALYWIKKHGWQNLYLAKTPIVSPEYCYATQHGKEDLLALFADGVAALKASGRYWDIYSGTIGRYDDRNLQRVRYLFVSVALLSILLFIAFAVMRTLKNTIQKRTYELEQEIEERKKLLAKVSEREKTFNLILNSTAEGIYGVDTNGLCTFFNRAAQSLLGYAERELLGHDIQQVIAHTEASGKRRSAQDCRLRQAYALGVPAYVEDAILWKKDGDWLNVAYNIHPIKLGGQTEGAVVTFTDISDKKKLIEQRIRSGQLSALGELAAGVAHEINNPITGVINYAQIMLNKFAENDNEKKLLSNIIKEGDRVAVIVKNLLNFAHKDRDKMQPVVVHQIIDEAIELLRQQLVREGIFLDIDVDDDLPQIYGNAQKLEQVVLNLVSNARHALNDRHPDPAPDKILRISAETVGRAETLRVKLTILDHGTGMCAEDVKKAFNRFFTTKPAGVGTGLGLSIVHDILEEHGGHIDIESEVGLYTKVSMEFPVCNSGVDGFLPPG